MQENFTTVAIVCHRYERLAVLQNVSTFILLWASKDVEKLLETAYKDKERKEEAETKSSVGTFKMPKLARIAEQSNDTSRVFVSVFILSDHCIKQIHSTLPWACSVTDHRRRQNVVRTSVTHLPEARVPLLCFYHTLTSSVIYYWIDRRVATSNLFIK